VIVSNLRLWVMVAGPYRSGSSDPSVWSANLRKLNEAACAIFQKGHVPIIGVNMALPLIESLGPNSYDTIMMPLSLSLTERCDAVLRIGGPSKGADDEVDRFIRRGLRVFHSIDEIPDGPTMADRLIPASSADKAWLEQLRRDVYQELFRATFGGWDEVRHARQFAECWERGQISIIEVDGNRVGMIQLFEDADAVEVGEIQIDPRHQNKGTGGRVRRVAPAP